MNNREKATEVIRTWQKRHKTVMDSDPAWAAQNLAGDLADAGVFAADPPTMDNVQWSDEEHYLAGAEDYDGDEVIMLGEINGNIQVCDVDQVSVAPVLEHPKNLTPNGKRYALVEIDSQGEGAHPTTLVTLGDYENAPIGTIVDINGTVVERGRNGWYIADIGARYGHYHTHLLGPGTVRYWG